jgi:hypothetical protein
MKSAVILYEVRGFTRKITFFDLHCRTYGHEWSSNNILRNLFVYILVSFTSGKSKGVTCVCVLTVLGIMGIPRLPVP